jgi:(p)ppGpp synthase/HD superfamily hydrolase
MGVGQLVPGSADGLPVSRVALQYAASVHAGQVRKVDAAPFIAHPREVAAILFSCGASDEVIAAGALHDVIEKTPLTAFDLRRRFGSEVAGLVLAVSEDRRIRGYGARKARLLARVSTAGDDALQVFAADKISKVRELRTQPRVFSPRAVLERRRCLAHYRKSLRLLEDRTPGSPLVAALARELRDVATPL